MYYSAAGYILLVSLVNFIPIIFGYEMSHDYIIGISMLNEPAGLSFKASLIASLATTAPVILDYILDNILYHVNDCIEVVPKRFFLLLVFIPDLLIIAVILPLEQYALLPAIMCARDGLYIFGWLTYMNQFCPKLWSLAWITAISSCFGFANVLTTFTTYRLSGNNTDDSDAEDTQVVNIESICLLICIVIGIVLYLLRFYQWLRYYYSMDTDGRRRLVPCQVYSTLFLVYLAVDWCYSDLWGFDFVDMTYWTLYTCMMTFCTLVAVVMSVRMTRMEAIEAKVGNSEVTGYLMYLTDAISVSVSMRCWRSRRCLFATSRMKSGHR